MSLDYFIICDLESGTFFSANNAVILDTRWLSEVELAILNEGGDYDRSELCEKHGSYLENWVDGNLIERPLNDT